MANTSDFAGSARVTLLFEDGTTAERVVALQPKSRTNVPVDVATFPTSANRRYGAVVESLGATPAQIVVERAQYLGCQRRQLGRGHERARDEAAINAC